MEEALHDVPLYRDFAGLDGGMVRLPDETTILRFRHLLEMHDLSNKMFVVVNDLLRAKGLLLKAGTAVDATLISRPVPPRTPVANVTRKCSLACDRQPRQRR